MITIPKTFELMGHTIAVKHVDDLVERQGAYGMCHPEKLLIELQTPHEDISKAFMLQTFLHECVHIWCFFMGYMELYSDEKFVDVMANCIVQFIKTKRGRPD